MRLYEKYRPTSLNEVVGQEQAKRVIACALRNGAGGKAFWISGPSGTGKTTLGRIIASTMADDLYVCEFDSADDVTNDVLRDIEHFMHYFGGVRGGRAYIINEAHGLKSWVVRKLLGLLERVPSHVVFVFTTTAQGQKRLFDNQIDASPLLSRCIEVTLTSEGLTDRFAKRCRTIAQAEGLDGQPLGRYIELARSCQNNLRRMIQAVESGKMLRS